MAVAACDKDGGGAKGSGAATADELALFKLLPGGNVGLFGGNYMKMQNFMSSTIGKAAAAAFNDGKGEAWLTCFSQRKDLKIAGAVAVQDAKLTMRIAFSGMKVTDIADCAKKSDFKTALDADNKYVSIDITTAGQTVTQGYLELPSGQVYSRTTMAFGGLMPSFVSAARADLEADVAPGKPTAADDAKLLTQVGKVDRSRTFWFAGSAVGTPVASTVGDIYGSIDLDGGMNADVTVQLMDSNMADKVSDGLKEAKKHADQLPGDLKGAIEGLDVSRDGDHLRFRIKLSEKQLTSLMSLGAMGMGRRH